LAKVAGESVGGGDGVGTGLEFDSAVAAVRTNLLIDQPVRYSIQRLTARAANTIVRWASMESCARWQIGRVCRSLVVGADHERLR